MESQYIPQNSFWTQIQSFMVFIWMALVDVFQTFINLIKDSEKSKELSSNISENMEKGNLLSGISTSSDCSETYTPSNVIAWSPVNMTAKEAKETQQETQEQMPTDNKIISTKSWADFSDSEAEHIKTQIQEIPIQVEKLEVVEEVSSTESDNESEKSESDKSESDPASFVDQTEVKKLSESAPEPEKKKKKTRRGKRNNKKSKESTSDSEISNSNTQTNTNPKKQNPSKKNSPIKEKEEDDRFIHFRKRRDQNYYNNNSNNINNNTNFSRLPISPAYHAFTAKDLNEAPRKFSHSLMPKLRDEVQEAVRPVRQPIGPMLGSNGFSSEYRRSRVLAA